MRESKSRALPLGYTPRIGTARRLCRRRRRFREVARAAVIDSVPSSPVLSMARAPRAQPRRRARVYRTARIPLRPCRSFRAGACCESQRSASPTGGCLSPHHRFEVIARRREKVLDRHRQFGGSIPIPNNTIHSQSGRISCQRGSVEDIGGGHRKGEHNQDVPGLREGERERGARLRPRPMAERPRTNTGTSAPSLSASAASRSASARRSHSRVQPRQRRRRVAAPPSKPSAERYPLLDSDVRAPK